MEARKNKRTSNRRVSRAAGVATEPGLIAIGRGLVRAGEGQAPSREQRKILLRASFGGWGFVLGGQVVRSMYCCTKPGSIVRCGNYPTANQHWEEEGDNEARRTPRRTHGASQGQGAGVEAVKVQTSSITLGRRNMIANTFGSRIIPHGRGVDLSTGVRMPPVRGRQAIGRTLSKVRGARALQGRQRGFRPERAYVPHFSTRHLSFSYNSNSNSFTSACRQGSLWSGKRRLDEQEARGSRGHGQSN